MKRRCLLLVCAVLLCCVTPVHEVFGITGEQVMAEIQGRYEKTDDLEADFVQEYVGRVMQRPEKGEGHVFFKKKGMMRWDYRRPSQKLITNGQTLWFYQPEESQVFVSDIAKVIQEKTPLAFLAGEGNLGRDFELVKFNEALAAKEDHYVLELKPREPDVVLSKLVLMVDKKSFLVTQTDVIDGLGNITRTRFLDIKTNVGLTNALFYFTIPPGTEILRSQEPTGSSPPEKGTPSK